ncbi:MAG: hypothetical protein H6978_04655 [Gammaproteobacteria bacterium]|nr:hypothetical protein [Gammaproteobacteria bacterium]
MTRICLQLRRHAVLLAGIAMMFGGLDASAQSGTSPDPCVVRSARDTELVDRVHGELAEAVCSTSKWFDSFFGNPSDYDAYRATYGSISVGSLWDEYHGFDPRLRFKARMQLPQLNGRLNAFVGRVDEDEFIAGSPEQFAALPSQFRQVDDEKLLLGIGYSRPGLKGYIDADVGIHLDIPLNPYTRVNYRRAWSLDDDTVFRFRQSAFWQEQEGLGTSTKLDFDHELNSTFLFRVTSIGMVAERTSGVEWSGLTTLFHGLDDKNALAYQVGVEGKTGSRVPVQDYGARIIYRRQFIREYLILELRTGISWPRERVIDKREFTWGVGAAIELRFGNWPHIANDSRGS